MRGPIQEHDRAFALQRADVSPKIRSQGLLRAALLADHVKKCSASSLQDECSNTHFTGAVRLCTLTCTSLWTKGAASVWKTSSCVAQLCTKS